VGRAVYVLWDSAEAFSNFAMKLILVRHGESTENERLHQGGDPTAAKVADPDLTSRGYQQAYVTGGFLKDTQTKHIWTSCLKRARLTAGCIRDFQLDAKITQMPELNEKNEKDTGRRRKETIEEFARRVALFRGVVDMRQEDLIIVGHSLFISILTSLLLNEPVREPLVYRNPNCAITRFDRENGQWKLLEQGSIDHLSPQLRTGVELGEDLFNQVKSICQRLGQQWTEHDIPSAKEKIHSFFEMSDTCRTSGTIRLTPNQVQVQLFCFAEHNASDPPKVLWITRNSVYNINIPPLSADLRTLQDLKTGLDNFRESS
jgi:broad specificity phosphatase PhoE